MDIDHGEGWIVQVGNQNASFTIKRVKRAVLLEKNSGTNKACPKHHENGNMWYTGINTANGCPPGGSLASTVQYNDIPYATIELPGSEPVPIDHRRLGGIMKQARERVSVPLVNIVCSRCLVSVASSRVDGLIGR